MLTKRINILFADDFWQKFSKLARAKNVSVGKLIRQAAEERYEKEIALKKRRKAIDYILKHRPAPIKGKIDYKEMINEGRRF